MQDEIKALKEDKMNLDLFPKMPIKAEPYEHQKKAFAMATMLDEMALFAEVGTGKTLVAIAAAGYHYQNNNLKRVIVFAPKSVILNWKKEFNKFANYHVDIEAIHGTAKQKENVLKSMEVFAANYLQVIVCSYETAWRMEKGLISWMKKANGKVMIIADEGHRIKTPNTKQSKCLHNLGIYAYYKMLLTGTPVSQSPLDLFSIYKFLNRNIFGNSFASFRSKYAIMGGFNNKEIIRYQNLSELTEKAHSIAFRVTKDECLDLPPETSVVRHVQLTKDNQKIYDVLRKESIVELEEIGKTGTVNGTHILTRMLRLSQITGGFTSTDDRKVVKIGMEKLNVLRDELEDLLAANKKVVIFCRFSPEVDAISSMLEDMAIHYVSIHGGTSTIDRETSVDDFQTTSYIKVFIAQIQCAGVGLTLTAADTAIFYSMGFSMVDHIQARGRIHRISQTRPCTYMYLLVPNSIDEYVYNALANKQELATRIVDEWQTYFGKE